MYQWIKKVTVVLVMFETLKADDLLVNTPSGPIRGINTKGYTGKEVSVFYGIPYAEPPVGNLRFRPPVYVKNWKNELNATAPSRACYQREFFSSEEDLPKEIAEFIPKKPWSEDCLKLHIWVPKPQLKNSTVMVYIHGGSFSTGYPLAPGLHGATLAAEENVIVVSMNYRLNVQGFLYLGIPEAPGNMGLMDQLMALRWIRVNIASFGGNPDDVTIFGMGAGGASVGFQLVSPRSVGLFKRAILMSGSPNAVWSIQTKRDALESSKSLAEAFGCAAYEPKMVLRCMQTVEPNSSLSNWNAGDFALNDLQFIPTVDGTFISDDPMTILRKKDANYPDIMIGNTQDEGSFFIREILPEFNSTKGEMTEGQFWSSVTKTFRKYARLVSRVNPLLYINWDEQDPSMWGDAFRDIMSDYYYTCATNDFADLYLTTTRRTVYRYVVDHHFDELSFPKWMGTPHASDTNLHLGMATKGGRQFSPDDVTLSRKVMRWFANFARTGNPNAPGQSGPRWDKSTLADKEYMKIAYKPGMEKFFRTQRCTTFEKITSVVQKHCHK